MLIRAIFMHAITRCNRLQTTISSPPGAGIPGKVRRHRGPDYFEPFWGGSSWISSAVLHAAAEWSLLSPIPTYYETISGLGGRGDWNVSRYLAIDALFSLVSGQSETLLAGMIESSAIAVPRHCHEALLHPSSHDQPTSSKLVLAPFTDSGYFALLYPIEGSHDQLTLDLMRAK